MNDMVPAKFTRLAPESVSDQAVEHIARKGTHCRLMVTPMVPFSVERLSRAPVARADNGNVGKVSESHEVATQWSDSRGIFPRYVPQPQAVPEP